MGDDSDRTADLLEAWYAGDREALQQLLSEHLDWMRRLVAREMQGNRTRLDSVDLVQEGVVRLLRRGPTYAPRSRAQFRALLATVLRSAHRDALDRLRAQRRDAGREERLPSAHISRLRPLEPTREGPATIVDRRVVRERVRLALTRLEPEERELITLRQHEGLPFEEVADRLGFPSPDAARMRFQRAVKKLSQVLLDLRRENRGGP